MALLILHLCNPTAIGAAAGVQLRTLLHALLRLGRTAHVSLQVMRDSSDASGDEDMPDSDTHDQDDSDDLPLARGSHLSVTEVQLHFTVSSQKARTSVVKVRVADISCIALQSGPDNA
jgi:hypothetical protein